MPVKVTRTVITQVCCDRCSNTRTTPSECDVESTLEKTLAPILEAPSHQERKYIAYYRQHLREKMKAWNAIFEDEDHLAALFGLGYMDWHNVTWMGKTMLLCPSCNEELGAFLAKRIRQGSKLKLA